MSARLLEGKVTMITGAGQGVGLGIAQAYATAGAKLVLTGRDASKLEGRRDGCARRARKW